MRLQTLLEAVPSAKVQGNCETEIIDLAYDSRHVKKGSLFFALPGQRVRGDSFIQEAIRGGAHAIVSQEILTPALPITYIQVSDAREAMARMARSFFSFPDRDLKVVGITGTNGKTTTAFLIQYLLQSMGLKCGLIGTIHYDLGNQIKSASHTTPESCDLFRLLQEMLQAGCRAVVMEVSSHALDQKRVWGIDFDVAVFTNLTRDHLDYHKTMASYFEAKQRLFLSLGQQTKLGQLVVNGDDLHGQDLVKNSHIPNSCLIFSQDKGDLVWEIVDWHEKGCVAKFSYRNLSAQVLLPLFGKFNIMNAAAALGTGLALGGNFTELVQALAHAPSVPGRLESVPNSRGIKVFVDYAHTDDALRKVLETLREIPHQKLLTVFGCGGNRDRSKRPLMGGVAAEFSDEIFVTTDNPRSEDAREIIKEISAGIPEKIAAHFIVDRKQAIEQALRAAKEGDIVLIAGKGHETYQEIKGVRYDFSDKAVAHSFLEGACSR